MAECKKSFVLYSDLINTVEKLILKDRENKTNLSGELFYHILQYVNDKNPVPNDFIIELAFEPIKGQLKRDLTKWSDSKELKSKAGRIGNLKRWNLDLYNDFMSDKITLEDAEQIALSRKKSQSDNMQSQDVAKIAVNVNDNVNVNVNDNVNDICNINNSIISEIKNFDSVSKPTKKQLIEKFKEDLLLNGADEKDLDDWISIRKEKKAQFSERALNTFLNECKENNYPVYQAVKICADNGWSGFKFEWTKSKNNGKQQTTKDRGYDPLGIYN